MYVYKADLNNFKHVAIYDIAAYGSGTTNLLDAVILNMLQRMCVSHTVCVLELFNKILVISSQYFLLESPQLKNKTKSQASTLHFKYELETNSIYNSLDENCSLLP